ncbi:MAG: DUF1015 family protein [Thermoanaerobaculia bacterium]
MELRPFRSLRYAPRVIFERGLAALLSPPVGRRPPGAPPEPAAPENILRVALPQDAGDRAAAAAETLSGWLSADILMRERRPGLWVYRRTIPREPEPLAPPLLIGLVRLATAALAAPADPPPPDPRTPAELLALRRALRADFEPCLLVTRAPLSGALSTNRQPDLSAEEPSGARHDAWRIHDYAEHVELQGLVKNGEAVLAEGRELWEAAREFEKDPEAAKLSGARFKLCAIVEETRPREGRRAPLSAPALGLFGVSLADPVY